MLLLALHNLFQHKIRLVISVIGIALSMTLIVLLNGLLRGIYVQVTAYLDHIPSNWVVAQDGVTNLLGGTSILPEESEDLAQDLPGIEQVIPIIAQYSIIDVHEHKVVGYMVGYDPDIGGGPWTLVAGHPPEDDDEIVLDWVMADEHGLHIGDEIEILDEEFTIVGLSQDTSSWMANFFFIEKEAAEELLLTPDATSFLLIKKRSDADANIIEERLRRRLGDDVEVVPTEVIKQNDIDLLVKIFAVPMQVMVTIAFAVGTAILGMIIYTSTVNRANEYGVMKAIGIKNWQLYVLVVLQGLLIALLGVLLGIGLAWIVGQWIMQIYPKFLVVLNFEQIAPLAATGLLMGIVAALLPAYYLSKLDPAEVFRR